MSDTKNEDPVKLVKLSYGQDVVARASSSDGYTTLHKPLSMIQTPQGLGLDIWPTFSKETEIPVVISDNHIIAIADPIEELEEAYLKSIGEKTVVTPPSPSLLLPN